MTTAKEQSAVEDPQFLQSSSMMVLEQNVATKTGLAGSKQLIKAVASKNASASPYLGKNNPDGNALLAM